MMKKMKPSNTSEDSKSPLEGADEEAVLTEKTMKARRAQAMRYLEELDKRTDPSLAAPPEVKSVSDTATLISEIYDGRTMPPRLQDAINRLKPDAPQFLKRQISGRRGRRLSAEP